MENVLNRETGTWTKSFNQHQRSRMQASIFQVKDITISVLVILRLRQLDMLVDFEGRTDLDSSALIRQLWFVSLDSSAWIRQLGLVSLGSPAWIRQLGFVSLGSSGWIRQLGFVSLDASAWIRQLGFVSWIRQLGFFSLDSLAWTRQLRFVSLDSSAWTRQLGFVSLDPMWRCLSCMFLQMNFELTVKGSLFFES